MDTQTAIAAIKDRAAAARTPLYKLCDQAGVARNCFWRWENGDVPNVSSIGRLEDTLTAIEAARA